MGEARRRITTGVGKKDEWHGSKAHFVNCRPAEDRSGTTGKVGKGQSAAKEGRLVRNYNVGSLAGAGGWSIRKSPFVCSECYRKVCRMP